MLKVMYYNKIIKVELCSRRRRFKLIGLQASMRVNVREYVLQQVLPLKAPRIGRKVVPIKAHY